MKLAGCIIKDKDGRILLIHRNTDKWQHWEVPGGKIEAGESPEQAAVREISEELGVAVKITKLIGDKKFQEKDYELHYTWFEAVVTDGEPRLVETEIFDDLNYFTVDDMAKVSLSTGAQNFLVLLQNELS